MKCGNCGNPMPLIAGCEYSYVCLPCGRGVMDERGWLRNQLEVANSLLRNAYAKYVIVDKRATVTRFADDGIIQVISKDGQVVRITRELALKIALEVLQGEAGE